MMGGFGTNFGSNYAGAVATATLPPAMKTITADLCVTTGVKNNLCVNESTKGDLCI